MIESSNRSKFDASEYRFMVFKNGISGAPGRKLAGVTLLVLIGSMFSWIYFVNPLPSDEAMIEHFNENRAEYEELATSFIQAIKDGDEATKAWMTSSRTLDLKKLIKARDERNTLEKDQWLNGVRANVDLPGYENKGSIEFAIENGFKFSWREINSMWKVYMYFPEIKPPTQGKLDCPVGTEEKCLASFGIPILDSLNGYPQFYTSKKPNCGSMAKKIDDHWYIFLIRAC